MAEVSFKTSGGNDPAQYLLEIKGAVQPTLGDALYAAQRQRTRIVDRTLQGVDVNGSNFEPYDTSRPYYYYPNGRVGRIKATAAQNKAAVRRLLKRTAAVTEIRSEYGGYEGVGGVATRSGQGIRFESYADFKASLGRAGVDLTGPRAPHMMQAIEVRADGASFGTSDSSTSSQSPVTAFSLGIYGEPAGRARGHNSGFSPRWARRHQRYFFGANAQDLKDMVQDIWTRIQARLRKVKG